MRTIHKFDLPPNGQAVLMPADAKVLCCQVQGEIPMIWAEVDDASTKSDKASFVKWKEWHFDVVATGDPLPAIIGTYIDSFQLFGGQMVFHVYERAERRILSS